MGQRNSEDRGGVDFRGDGLVDRAEGIDVLSAHVVGAVRNGAHGVDGAVHAEEDGHLGERREAGCEGAKSVLLLEGANFFLLTLARSHIGLTLVLGLNFLHFRLNRVHSAGALNLLEVERNDEGANQNGQQNN